jgi:hypothetical protein
MKFAYFNPTVVAIEEVPTDIFVELQSMVETAHQHNKFNDEGDPLISIRGGQQIHLVPNEFQMDTSILQSYIEKVSAEYFENVLQVNGQAELKSFKTQLVSAWTIKQTQGDYQALHSHDSHISGNIYIDIPELEEESKVSDCSIEFKFPVTKNLSTFNFVDSWRFKPQPMKMIIFPGHIPHTVYPWKGQGNRTILAWDVKLVK